MRSSVPRYDESELDNIQEDAIPSRDFAQTFIAAYSLIKYLLIIQDGSTIISRSCFRGIHCSSLPSGGWGLGSPVPWWFRSTTSFVPWYIFGYMYIVVTRRDFSVV